MLSESQFSVLFAIAKLEEPTIGEISQLTGRHRQSTKIILTSLKEFITQKNVGNKIIYDIKPIPKFIQTVKNEKNQILNSIKSLQQTYDQTKKIQPINLIKGELALRSVLLDEVIKGKSIRTFHLSPIREKYQKYYLQNQERRKEKNISLKVITSQNLPKSKDIKKTKAKSKINIHMYDQKTTITYEAKPIHIVTINSKDINQFFTNLFDHAYK